MSVISGASIIGELVALRPSAARVFEQLGIDYCCGGKMRLDDACRAKQLELSTVVQLIHRADSDSTPAAIDVAPMGLTELADHIVRTHHAYLKQELPRLGPLVEKIAARHSDKNPRLPRLTKVYSAFSSELQAHVAKEEQMIFPLIRQLDAGSRGGDWARGGIESVIVAMEREHQHAGDAIGLMRSITDGFTTPSSACNTYRAVMRGLFELEADLHQHVHLENNVLFPRALARIGSRATFTPVARP